MLKKTSKLERTAYHEAGHAVVAHTLGHATKRVSIIPDKSDNTLGHRAGYKTTINPEIQMNGKYKNRLEEFIVINFAGGKRYY